MKYRITEAALLKFAKKNSGKYFLTVSRARPFMVDVTVDDQIVCYPESGIQFSLTPSVQLKEFNRTNELHPGKYPPETFSNAYFVGLVAAMIRGTKPIRPPSLSGSQSRSLPPSAVFDTAVSRLRKNPKLPPPRGEEHPQKCEVRVMQVCRDPEVKAWVLKTSEGKCTYCGQRAPFKGDDNLPFLEVHHVRPLGDGGMDTVRNAVALCPNCHRAFHHAKDRKKRIKTLYRRCARLER